MKISNTDARMEPPLNRYANARRNADWTIDQDWSSYSDQEHDRWNRLFARQSILLPSRACGEFLSAMASLELSQSGIPDFAALSERLASKTGACRRRSRAGPRRRVLRPSR